MRLLDPIQLKDPPERRDGVGEDVARAIGVGILRTTWEVDDRMVEEIRDDIYDLEHIAKCAYRMKDWDMYDKCIDRIKDYAEAYMERNTNGE